MLLPPGGRPGNPEETLATVAVHEVAHLMHANHGDGEIMDVATFFELKFTSKSLGKIRNSLLPTSGD